MKRVLNLLPVLLGITLLSLLVGLQWSRVSQGQNDFVQFYVGAKLVGTPDLYSRAANQAMIQSILGFTMESVTYVRPQFYAVLFKPLTFLPYLAAYGIFCGACLASIVWFVARFSRECPALPLYASFSIPVGASFVSGQDTPFLLAILGASVLLTRQRKDLLAGLVLSLCTIKFHLFLFVPLLLLRKRRWRILAGAASGAGALFAAGVMVAGVGSIAQWVGVLRDPWINFSPSMMPNLHGLAATLGAGPAVEAVLAASAVLVFLWICSRTDDYELLLALSVLCGLLVSYHSGVADTILLLFIFVLIMNSSPYKPVRIVLALAVTPIPYFAMIPLSVLLPVLLLVVMGLAAVSLRRRSDALGSILPAGASG